MADRNDLSTWMTKVIGKNACMQSPVRPAEVIAGSSSSQYSYGDVTDTASSKKQGIEKGTRTNTTGGETRDTTSEYTGGSNPMQSPNLSGNECVVLRYGIGFLCANYTAPGWNDLSEVKGYQKPTSKYQQAFKGMNKKQQFNDPTKAQILAGIKAWTVKLATDLKGLGGHGKLVVSFQGHGTKGDIVAVDGKHISAQELAKLAAIAKKHMITMTFILDACESGGAVSTFQHLAADRADENADATKGAGQVCSQENEDMARALKDLLLRARQLIQFSKSLGSNGRDVLDASEAVETAEQSGNAAELNTAWATVMAVNNAVRGQIQAMQRQFQHTMTVEETFTKDTAAIETSFTNALKALNGLKRTSYASLVNGWNAKIGEFQDAISNSANHIIVKCNQRAKAYTKAS